jgi:hypothetical protein
MPCSQTGWVASTQALHVQAGTVAIAVSCMSAWPTHTRTSLRPILSVRLCLSHASALLTALHTKHTLTHADVESESLQLTDDQRTMDIWMELMMEFSRWV